MARVVSVSLDAARVEGVLSTGKRRVSCREAADAPAILARASTAPPDLVVLSGEASTAADVAEALLDDPVMLGTALVAWHVEGSLSDTSRLVALGVRVITGEEDALRTACDEALDAREGRTIRVEPRAEATATVEVPDLHGRRVIVADDDPAIRWFIADTLRARGCDVEEADDGEAALDRARRTAPDLVISDIRMPRLDGVNLCRALRADPILADVPIVLLSWKEDWLRHAEGVGVEASAYLAKRSTPEEVILQVHEVLEPHARLERRLRKPGPARGRLDGTAPYRLLRLACATHADSRLTVRSTPNVYEVRVREGIPRSATRVSGYGTVLRGVAALESLLGERTGRFTLASEQARFEPDLEGGLHQQIAPCVARSRRGLETIVQRAAGRPLDVMAPVAVGPVAALTAAVPAYDAQPCSVPVVNLASSQRHPEAAVHTVPLAPRPLAPRPVMLAPVQRVADSTLPLVRSMPPRWSDNRPNVPTARRPWKVPLRWAGVAAIAALGIVLGAGVRALRQAPASPPPAPVAAVPGR